MSDISDVTLSKNIIKNRVIALINFLLNLFTLSLTFTILKT
jgi:hypothetical protein